MAIAAAERVAEMPEVAVHLLHLHLQIAHRRTGGGAPIHQVFTAVDQPLLVQAHEGLLHRFTEAFIKGEALALPIHGITQPPQLAHDAATAFSLPLPGPLQETIAAEVVAGLALLLELLLEDRLHRDRGVIGAGQAEHVLSRQALVADDRVDQGRVEGMAHVQAAGHVWRRNHHRERFTGGLWVGVERSLVLPGLLPAGFRANRVVGLGQFGHGSGAMRGSCSQKVLTCHPTQTLIQRARRRR